LIAGQNSTVQKGIALFQQQQYEAALSEFDQAARTQPDNPALQNIIGLTDTKLGRIEDANLHYRKAIRLNPKLPDPHKNLGFNQMNAKQYEAAENELKTALQLAPTDKFAHYYLGIIYLATDRDRDAVEQLRGQESLLENDADTWLQFVMAELRLGRSGEAQAALAKLEGHFTLAAPQQYQLAVLLTEKQMYAQALDRFRRLAETSPSRANEFNLSVAYLHARESAEAIRNLENWIAPHPDDADSLSLLGVAYEADGKPAQALDAYHRALNADPQNPDRYLDYTRLLMDADRIDESAELVVRGLKIVKDAYALQLRLGSVQLMEGKYSEARQSFQQAIAEHPEIPLGYVAVARSYFKEGADGEAANVLSDARRKLPTDFMLEYFYGLALLRLQRNQEAAGVLENAVRLNPNVPEPHYKLGQAYFAMQRTERARAEFERVIQLAPQNANAYYQLSRLYAKQGDTAKAREMAEETKRLKKLQIEQGIELQRTRLESFRPVEAR
jgi:tetratricopeptide (TPR) repeat protein